MSKKVTYAKDCKCIECGKKAVAFWPMMDPDIPHHPYCRKCLDIAKMKVMIEVSKIINKNNQ